MDFFDSDQIHVTVQAAHFCEVALIRDGGDMIGRRIIDFYRNQIIRFKSDKPSNVKAESGISALVNAGGSTVYKKLRDRVCTMKFKKNLPAGKILL